MGDSSKRKSEFLKMPHGTAIQKLRKLLLFKLVQQTGQDACFRCQKTIESVDQLSIEHKEPWEGRSVELFWDLNNIAFSHVSCNRPHVHGGYKLRKVAPDDSLLWCTGCQDYQDKNSFGPDASRWTGHTSSCRKFRTDLIQEGRRLNGRK